jgi:transcriptional regulator with XRE-family HTH domain
MSQDATPASPNPPRVKLPDTLAQRVRFLREQRGVTIQRLAELCGLSVQLIEDIEAGIELFLAPSSRQRLARGLRVQSAVIKMVEKPVPRPERTGKGPQPPSLEALWANPEQRLYCPECGAELTVRMFERQDLQGHPIHTAKIHCTRCLYRTEREAPEPDVTAHGAAGRDEGDLR